LRSFVPCCVIRQCSIYNGDASIQVATGQADDESSQSERLGVRRSQPYGGPSKFCIFRKFLFRRLAYLVRRHAEQDTSQKSICNC
jgi:hypothetical protein